MDGKDFEVIVSELEDITRELGEIQKDIHREIESKITSIQKFIDDIPDSSSDTAPETGDVSTEAPKEVVIEENTIVIRQNGKTLFEGLY